MRGDQRGAGAAAAGAGDAGAALPDAQPDLSRGRRTVATPILARSGNSGSCSRRGPERGEVDRLGVGDKECRVRVADIGADRLGERAEREIGAQSCPSRGPAGCRASRCAPRPYRPRRARPPAARHRAARPRSRCRTRVLAGLLADQPGDAARAVAAGLGLAAVGIEDAHRSIGAAESRAGSITISWSQPMPVWRSASARAAAASTASGSRRRVEHDEIVAEPVHLAEADPAHGAAYMAGGPALSNAAQTGLTGAPVRRIGVPLAACRELACRSLGATDLRRAPASPTQRDSAVPAVRCCAAIRPTRPRRDDL